MTSIFTEVDIIDDDPFIWGEFITTESCNKTVKDVYECVSKHADIPECFKQKDLGFCIKLSNSQEVKGLNRDYRAKDKPTNVLSFALLDSPEEIAFLGHMGDEAVHVGDLVLALEVVREEAEAGKIDFHAHFTHLILHGLLHLLGYDHIEDGEAEIMESLEVRILYELNIQNPYSSC